MANSQMRLVIADDSFGVVEDGLPFGRFGGRRRWIDRGETPSAFANRKVIE
jgi:hypothetical protein